MSDRLVVDPDAPGLCVVPCPDAAAPRVLLLPAPGGAWSLPAVRADDDWWSATWVRRLLARVRRALGLDATLLRYLPGGLPWAVELEPRATAWAPPAGARWAGRGDLGRLLLADPAQWALLERWLTEAAGGAAAVPPRRAPWERRGWLAAAEAWAAARVAEAGEAVTGPAAQLKAGWPLSCVLRVPTSAGAVFFKADNRRPPSEPALVAALAARWPGRVPDVLASDPERRWMLTRDFGPRLLEGDYDAPVEPLATWAGAARAFARLQRAAAADAGRWRALGCEDRRPERLPDLLAALLADSAALRADEPGGVTPAEGARLESLLPAVRACCERLAAAGVPPSLVHQDFRGGNVGLTPGGYLFHDWSDTVLGHPFFSGERFVADAHHPVEEASAGPSGVPGRVRYAPAARQRFLREAYLEPWAAVAPPDRLREAFALARTLAPVWQAVRLHRELPYAEPDSPWAVAWARRIPPALRDAARRLATAG